MRILLVEDEPEVARFISKGLREQSFAVDVAVDGEQALYQAEISDYDIVVLDVMLPKFDGFQVCQRLRGQSFRSPILMLTARDGIDDEVEGLNCGADDYLAKPFDFRILLARIQALLRRAAQVRPNVIQVQDLFLNTLNHTAMRDGHDIRLTAKEYALLEFLMLHQGQILGRSAIAEHVWDENFDPFSNLIDVYIKRLRRKVDSGYKQPLIQTRRGEGYILGP
ncbi:MAG TPA: response regulator transcription factor [Bryobacteraceae bacterium]|nr:response regulator transcription factor [Bryobacteraceae bacterium]